MPSNASRYFFLFLLGLVVGAVAAVMTLRALQERQDPFPDSVMHVMLKHRAALAQNVTDNRCAVTDTLPQLHALRTMGNDLELAFPDAAEDKDFQENASALRAKLDAALAKPPTDCAAVGATVQRIKESCDGCHKAMGT